MLQHATRNAVVVHMSATDKIGEAIRRSLPHIPAEAQTLVRSLLHPHSLAIVAGTLAVWAGSHAFGIGEIVDIILIGIGVATVGFSVFEGAAELYSFVTGAQSAQSEADLEKAGQHFAHAVTLLGISTLQAVLLRGQGRTISARSRPPKIHPLPNIGLLPPAGNQLTLFRVARLPRNRLGITNAFGEIVIARNQTITDQRITLLHELVHRYFSPRTGPFRQLRAQINMSAYERSALLCYLEETLAEGYAQLRVNGFASALETIRFPLKAGYVTASELASEGRAIGTISLGGTLLYVSISTGALKP
jgi:hypothetical protein